MRRATWDWVTIVSSSTEVSTTGTRCTRQLIIISIAFVTGARWSTGLYGLRFDKSAHDPPSLRFIFRLVYVRNRARAACARTRTHSRGVRRPGGGGAPTMEPQGSLANLS